MSGTTAERRITASILESVSRGRRLDRAFGEVAGALGPRERRWVHEAAYGVVRFRGRLDHLLHLHLHQGLRSLSSRVLELLRLGAYQLLFMDSVPSYAAISQTVEQVRSIAGSGPGRMANGVLRTLDREGGEVGRFPTLEEDPLAHLTTWGSHPEWLVKRWLFRWDPDEVGRLVEWNNTQPPLFVRPLGISLEEGVRRLKSGGVEARIPSEKVPCLQLEGGTDPATFLEGFPAIVQDPGSALVTVYADPPPGSKILDLCAAPGGKALALAAEGSYVLAADRSLSRMRWVGQNLKRVGGDVVMVVADARKPPFSRAGFALVDVPCSGTGTMRRHPDARWRLTPEMLETLVNLQREIMQATARLIPPGGYLVYSTCTLEEEENEEQVDTFLRANPGFQVEGTDAVDPSFLDERGLLRVVPQVAGFDGAFAARLVRRS